MIKRVLFVSGRNKLRSPTAEQVFGSRADLEVASAGLDADSDVPCSAELVEWADIVFVMEGKHRSKLSARFGRHLRDTGVICLDIPDRFAFMDPTLVRLLNAKAGRHLL